MYTLSNPIVGRCFVNALLEVPRFGMCLYPSRPDPAKEAGAGLGNTPCLPKTRTLCNEQNQPAQDSAHTVAPRSDFICSYTLVGLFLQLIFFYIIVKNSFKLNSEVNLCNHICKYNLRFSIKCVGQ